MGNKSRNSFLIQGSILAFAGILVRVVGLLYRIPLNRILGDVGLGYYGTAFDFYNILILLSSQSMPLAVSKIVSEKLQRRQFRNAHKVFKGALMYGALIGTAFGLFLFFGADWIASTIYKMPPVAIALRVLAPTLTIACILGVVRGYFQGMGNMVPTAVSQVFEQIVNAFVSILAAYELGAYGYTLSKVAAKSEELKDAYAAAGGTLGTLSGAFVALLFMFFIVWINKDIIRKRKKRDRTGVEDSYGKITKVILFTITPVLLSTTIYNIGNLLDNPIYQNIMVGIFASGEKANSASWGMYSGYYRTLTTMPIAIASSLSTAIVPSLVRSYITNDGPVVKSKITLAQKFSMLIAFPCGMGLSVLGGPINALLFGTEIKDTVLIMSFSVFTVVAFSLSTISNAILQGINKLNIPIRNSAISLAVHLILLPILLIVFKLGIYAVVIGDFTFAMTVAVLNSFSIKRCLGYRQEIHFTLIRPFICSVIMGICCFGVYKLGMIILNVNAVWTIISIIIAVIVYGIVLIFTKTITEEELYSMPKGASLAGILNKFHLL